MIEGFAVEPVRKKVDKDLNIASQCFRRQCPLLSRADRERLKKTYNEWANKGMLWQEKSDNPSDGELLDALGEVAGSPYSAHLYDHDANRDQWPLTVYEIFSESNRSLFRDRFNLDIWHSFVRLPHHQGSDSVPGFGLPQATIAYLTLPDSAKTCQRWAGNEEYDDPDGGWTVESNDHENGFGVAVEICRPPSAEELDRFSKALKFLKLQPFIHNRHQQGPALRLGLPDKSINSDTPNASKESDKSHLSGKAGVRDGKNATAIPFPRPTLSESGMDHFTDLWQQLSLRRHSCGFP